MNFLVIGESCVDTWVYGDVPRLAPEGPAPVFIPTRTVTNPGMAANVVENLKALGVTTGFITNPNRITKTRYVDDKTNHLMLRIDVGDKETLPVNYNFTSRFLSQYDAVLISDYRKGFITEEHIFSICNLHDNVFIDTKKVITPAFKMARLIKINDYEYKLSEASIKLIPELESKLVVTMGKNGSRLGNKIYPVPLVEVRDLAGAGDTFLAALSYKYMETKDIDKAIIFANDSATKVVQSRGVTTV